MKMIIGASIFRIKRNGGEIPVPETVHHQIEIRNGKKIRIQKK